jgi:RNA polymerase sigma-70 factor (ECF subfamily)
VTEHQFGNAFRSHHGAIFIYAKSRLQTQSDAEDLAAETFVVAWRRRDRLPEEPSTRGWLYAVASRLIANRLRTERRQGRLVRRIASERLPLAEGLASETESQSSFVMEALAELSPRHQEILRLNLWEELSYAEIAVVLSCSESAVGTRLCRARLSLRQQAQRLIDDEPIDHIALPRERRTQSKSAIEGDV